MNAQKDAERYLKAIERDEELADELPDPVANLAMPQIDAALASVRAERVRQDDEWGWFRDFPDGTGSPSDRDNLKIFRENNKKMTSWRVIFLEEVMEALAEHDSVKLEAELIQVAAVATAWVEALRRRRDGKTAMIRPKPWWRKLWTRIWFRKIS